MHSLLALMEALAILAFAVAGLMEARKKRLDVVGMYIVSFLSAFGGGTIRDLLLERRPFYWVAHQEYTILILVLTLLASTVLRERKKIIPNRVILTLDAIGLGLFSITGCSMSLALGMPPFIAAMMGVVTAIFGGIMRDVMCGEIPLVLKDNQPYALCAFTGCWIYIILAYFEVPEFNNLLISSTSVFLIRMVAWKLKIHLPPPH